MNGAFLPSKPLIWHLMRSRQIETEQDALRVLDTGIVSLRALGDPAWIKVGPSASQLPLLVAGQVRVGDAEVLEVDGHRPPDPAFRGGNRSSSGGVR
jgi:hypothetical protein